MANSTRPRGFKPYGELRQAVSLVSGGAVYPGDCVKMDNTGRIVAAAAGDAVFGVALEYASAAASNIMVSVHPEQLYVAQASGSELDAQTDIGNCCDIVATAGNSTYKDSRMAIDSSTVAASSAQFLILGFEARPDNAAGAQADVICKINEHQAFGKDAFAGI